MRQNRADEGDGCSCDRQLNGVPTCYEAGAFFCHVEYGGRRLINERGKKLKGRRRAYKCDQKIQIASATVCVKAYEGSGVVQHVRGGGEGELVSGQLPQGCSRLVRGGYLPGDLATRRGSQVKR